jgi:hypothetical protein
MKVDWLAACIAVRVVGAVLVIFLCTCHFPPTLAYNLHIPPANGKQGLLLEERSRTLLTH